MSLVQRLSANVMMFWGRRWGCLIWRTRKKKILLWVAWLLRRCLGGASATARNHDDFGSLRHQSRVANMQPWDRGMISLYALRRYEFWWILTHCWQAVLAIIFYMMIDWVCLSGEDIRYSPIYIVLDIVRSIIVRQCKQPARRLKACSEECMHYGTPCIKPSKPTQQN